MRILKHILICCLIVSCNSKSAKPNNQLLDCSNQCDSVVPMVRDGIIIGYSQFFNGEPTNHFVLFERGDTVLGYREKLGIYKKSSFKYDANSDVVKLLSNFDGRMQISEFIQFEDDTIWKDASHFIEFEEEEAGYLASFHLKDKIDTIKVLFNKKEILKVGANEELVISKDVLLSLNPSEYLDFAFADFRINEDSLLVESIYTMHISKDRVINASQVLQPNFGKTND